MASGGGVEARTQLLAQAVQAGGHVGGADAEDVGDLAVVVIASPKPSEKIPAVEQLMSAGALCMNILHAATAAGWGANWLTGWVSHDAAFIARAFGCTPGESVAGIIHIATPAAPMPDRPRPDLARVVSYAGV